MFQDIKYIFKQCGWLLLFFLVTLLVSLMSVKLYSIVLLSGLGLCCIPIKKYINGELLTICFFSIFYSLLLFINGLSLGTLILMHLISPIFFYCFGGWIVDKLKHPHLIVSFLFLMTFFFSLNLYISIIYDIFKDGFIDATRVISVKGLNVTNARGENTIAATLLGLSASLSLVGFAIFVYYREKLNKILRFSFLFLFLFSLISVVHLVNRTGLVLIVAVFVIITLYLFRNNFWRIFRLCFLLFFCCFCLYQYNSDISNKIFQAYQDREENSIEVSKIENGGGRIKHWSESIVALYENPWGFARKGVSYAHNLWLDIGRVGGFLPLIPLLIATILYGINFLKLMRKDNAFLNPIFLGYNIIFFLSCMVEPIMEGFALYFYLYVMFWGMQRRYLYLLNKNVTF